MKSMRKQRTGRFRPVRLLSGFGVVAALGLAAAPLPVSAFAAEARPAYAPSGQDVSDFYEARGGGRLWFGNSGRQTDVLLELLASAELDGLDPDRYRLDALTKAVRAARKGNARAVRKAELMLSNALFAYARDLRRPVGTGVIYVDRELRPAPPTPRAILSAAAAAPSLERYVASMGWMHPLYGEIRHALRYSRLTGEKRELALINRERARELPPSTQRHVLVNAAAQRLFMYENGQVVDSMRVVVGKPKNPTPMMAALIRYTNLNPYWYVPPDLAAERIAPNVLDGGMKYLKTHGYQVLTGFEGDPEIIDPKTIDWKAVADGSKQVYMRQLPGPGNAMGRMKFMFPNYQGIYLHDTPDKELLEEASRLFSGGCVRLEAAKRLAKWLHGEELSWKGAKREEKVPLPRPVPVYITYLTAVPSGNFQLAFFDDIYGRDAQRLAQRRGGRRVAAR